MSTINLVNKIIQTILNQSHAKQVGFAFKFKYFNTSSCSQSQTAPAALSIKA